jgi:hypothetical protein
MTIDYSRFDKIDYSSSSDDEKDEEEGEEEEEKVRLRLMFEKQLRMSSAAKAEDADDDENGTSDKPSPLWQFISSQSGMFRDIFEDEIVGRLNSTDIKFLYEVNSESREAVKRSKIKFRERIKLKEKFRIMLMSSVSTLEVAWAGYPFGEKRFDGAVITLNEESFCEKVAVTNDLKLLRWVREVKKCAWDERVSNQAVRVGNMEMLKYCFENGNCCAETCTTAASAGRLECLEYLRKKKVPFTWMCAGAATQQGHFEILKYLVKNKCDITADVVTAACRYGRLNILEYLTKVVRAPNNYQAIVAAQFNNHTECVDFCEANDFAIPTTEEYEKTLQSLLYVQQQEIMYEYCVNYEEP